MPYDFLRLDRADDELQIQRELDAWRLQMREERQRRLREAAAKTTQTQIATEGPAFHEVLSRLDHADGGRKGKKEEEAERRAHFARRHDTTALQEYRMELNETRREAHRRKSAPSCLDTKTLRQKNTNLNAVTYHKAQSVLKEYICRPPPLLAAQDVPREPNGSLRAYKDALSVSMNIYSRSKEVPSSWHRKPTRKINNSSRPDQASGALSCTTTRSAILRKRHTEQWTATGGVKGRPVLRSQKSNGLKYHQIQPGYHSRELLGRSEAQLSTMLSHQHCGNSFSYDADVCSDKFNPTSYRHRQKSNTQPMISPSLSPDDSPQPRQPPIKEPYPVWEKQPLPTDSHSTPREIMETQDVAVSPPTPVQSGFSTLHSSQRHFRRDSSPLLTELLTKLTQPTTLLYRPDLYQGRKRSDIDLTPSLSPSTTGTQVDHFQHGAKAFYLNSSFSRGE